MYSNESICFDETLHSSERVCFDEALYSSDELQSSSYYLTMDNAKGNIFYIKNEVSQPKANIILLSPFGENSHSLLLIAWYLWQNNFNVIRFDGVNNVGLSSGNIKNFTLSQVANDLDRTLNELEDEIATIVIAFSINAPVAIKSLAADDRIDKVISVVGVVDMTESTEAVIEGSISCYKNRDKNSDPLVKVFGHDIDIQTYVDDMLEHGYENASDTLSDIAQCNKPINFIIGDKDEYVSFSTFNRCIEHINERSNVKVYPGAGHELNKSLALVRRLATDIVAFSEDNPNAETIKPNLAEIVKHASIESTHLLKCTEIIKDQGLT